MNGMGRRDATRRMILIALVVAVMTPLVGCVGGPAPVGTVVGSGRPTTVNFDIKDFNGVQAGGGNKVDITQSGSYSVSITVDDNLVSYLDVTKRGQTLQIGLKPGSYSNYTLQAKVTMPSLTNANLSGAAQGTATGFNSSDGLKLDLSGGASFIGRMNAGDTNVTASGAGTGTLDGAGKNLNLNGSGGAVLNLGSYAVNDASVTLSGGSVATVNAKGRLDANVSGGARLDYVGNPSLGSVTTSGGGTINKK
jgi:hypothetical protein